MRQMTIRVPEGLLKQVKSAAGLGGRSVNAWVTAVLSAAVNPDLADDEMERVRERLVRAGLVAPSGDRRMRPSRAAVLRARAAAGRRGGTEGVVAQGRR